MSWIVENTVGWLFSGSHIRMHSYSDASMGGKENSMIAYVQAIVDEDETSRRQGFGTDKSKLTLSHFSNVLRAAWLRGRWVLLAALCWYLWSRGYLHILLVGCDFLYKLLEHIRIGLSTTIFVRNLTSALFGEILEKGRPAEEPEDFSEKRSCFGGSSRRWEETPITAGAVHENGLPSADLVLQMDSQLAFGCQQRSQDVLGKSAISRTTVGGDNSTTRAHVGGVTSSSTSGKTKANQPSRRSSKRKRQSSRKGKKKGSESDDEADENDDPNHGQQGEEPDLPLACPYWKARRGRYRECYDYNLRGISELKQHFRRVHKAPDWYCFTCHEALGDEDRYQAHFRANQCSKRDGPDFIRPDVLRKILERTPRRERREAWHYIYSTLFPDLPRPDNPYLTEENPECVEHMSNLLSLLSPQTLRRMLADVSSQQGQMTESQQKTKRVLTEAVQLVKSASHSEESINRIGEQTTDQSPIPQNFDAPHHPVSNEIGGESFPGLAAVGSGMSEDPDEYGPDMLASEMDTFYSMLPSSSNQHSDTSVPFLRRLRDPTVSDDLVKSWEPIPPQDIHGCIQPSLLVLNQPQRPSSVPRSP